MLLDYCLANNGCTACTFWLYILAVHLVIYLFVYNQHTLYLLIIGEHLGFRSCDHSSFRVYDEDLAAKFYD